MSEDNDELNNINDSTTPEGHIGGIESAEIVDNETDDVLETKAETPEEINDEINIEASVDNEEPLNDDISNKDTNLPPEIISQDLDIGLEESSKPVEDVTPQASPNELVTPDIGAMMNVDNSNESVTIQAEYDGNISGHIGGIESAEIVDNETDDVLETKAETPEEINDEINIEASVDNEEPLNDDISNKDTNLPPEIISQDLDIGSEESSKPVEDVTPQASPNELVTPDIGAMMNVDNSNESVTIREEYDGNISEKISELFLTDSSDKTSNLETNQDSGSHREVRIYTEREEYMKKFRELIAEKTQLTLKNTLFHKKLAEYFKKRKITPAVKEYGNEEEKEKHYRNLLLKYEKMKNEETLQRQMMQEKLDDSKKLLDSRLQEFKSSFTAFQELEKTTANGLIHTATGKRLSEQVVNRYLARQSKKMEDVSSLRLQYIRYKNMIQETEKHLRELNKLGGGLHLSDYERLQKENQNLMKKLEERDDQLARQRNLCVEYNQILAHIKEEMHCEDEMCEAAEYDVTNAEQQFTNAREKLTSAKQQRDTLKSDLVKEHSMCGLLAHQNLLGDFEATIQMASELRTKKDVLQEEVNLLRANTKSRPLSTKTVTSASRVRPRLHCTANLKPSIGDCYHK